MASMARRGSRSGFVEPERDLERLVLVPATLLEHVPDQGKDCPARDQHHRLERRHRQASASSARQVASSKPNASGPPWAAAIKVNWGAAPGPRDVQNISNEA